MLARFIPGLCSVTLRALPAHRVVELAADAGLQAIEWGGDVHVPAGDVATADAVRRRTEEAGLSVCSYGSYFGRAGKTDDFAAVVEAACALGAPCIRIWAGSLGSLDTTAAQRAELVATVQAAADQAMAVGVQLAFEFHPKTLTDSVGSTLQLLAEVDRENVATYWQPPLDLPDDDAVAGLRQILDDVVTVHAFSWWPGQHRRQLDSRSALWRAVAAALSDRPEPVPVLLEFVPEDAPEAIRPEAAALRHLFDLDATLLDIDDRSLSE